MIKTRDAFLAHRVVEVGARLDLGFNDVIFQRSNLAFLLVFGDDFAHLFDLERVPIGEIIGIGKPHQAFENVLFLADGNPLLGDEFGFHVGEILERIHV